jgi:hypothetical protein
MAYADGNAMTGKPQRTLEKLAELRFDALELAIVAVVSLVLGVGLGRLLNG